MLARCCHLDRGVIYLLAWYVPDVLVRHKVDTSVESAWISAVATLLGVGATAAVAIFAFWYARLTNQATIDAAHANLKDQREQLDKTFAEQREQLNKTLAAQREQLDSTLAEQRTRTLNERFAAAAGQLGSDKPAAVRLAGVYAIAGLADDWEENRQTCVDVLCGYLRMPYEPDPGGGAAAEKQLDFRAGREVRHTAIRVITAHLKDDAAVSWRGLNFDFTGAAFDGGDFARAEFSGGRVSFDGAVFSGGEVSFSRAVFSAGEVSFTVARFSDGTVSFTKAEFTGGRVSFYGAEFSGDLVSFSSARFSGGEVSFEYARFSGGMVSFGDAEFTGGRVSFGRAGFSGGTVFFTGARFSAGEVSFTGAVFSGGEVYFDRADDWSVPPAFPWTGVPPQGVKLSKKEDQAQA
jgi:uncharacterized protein YjbI with pentapeptide repeats/uncharacterized membrane-anchored protein YhcB (DUF1043 family)